MSSRGQISVDVVGDTSKFPAQVARDLKKAAAEIDVGPAFKKVGEDLGDALGDGITRDSLGRLRDARGRFIKAGEEAGAAFGEGFKRDVNGRLRDSRGKFVKESDVLGGVVGKGFLGGLKGILEGAQGIGKQISGAIGAAGPYIQAAAVGMAAVLAAAVGPAIVALGASLPAAGALGAAAIGTLTLAFRGLSDAIDNADDPEKFAEALEKLSPAARNFAVELKDLLPVFRSIKESAQEGFFKGLEGQLTSVVTTLEGPLKNGFFKVGQSLQHFVKEMGDLAKSSLGITTINNVFATTARIIDKLTPSMQIFTAGILDLINSALPFVEKLSDSFGILLEEMGQGLNELSENGTLDKFFDDALVTLKQLWGIAENVGGALKGIFKALGGESEDTLANIEDLTKAMEEFFNDPDVIWALATAFGALKLAVGYVQAVIKATLWVVKNLGDAFRGAREWVEGAADSIKEFGSSVKESVTGAFDSAKESVSSFFSSVGTWFSELPGKVGAWLSALPGVVFDFFSQAMSMALQALGMGIGLLIYAFTELPSQIWSALQELPSLLSTFFTDLWTSVSTWTSEAWNNTILPFISGLPGRIWEALSSLPGILGDFFSQLGSDIWSWVTSAFNSVVDYVAGVPGRISALASRFVSAGAGIIRGFFDGLSNVGGLGSRLGNAVYGALKSGLNWGISQINAGLARVDDMLPGSLPRIPQLADGGLALGRTLAEIGEEGREMVVPLTGSAGKTAISEFAAALGRQMGDSPQQEGLRVWPSQGQSQSSEPLTLVSDGSKLSDLLIEIIAKAVRVRGGDVQKVIGKAMGGVA